MADIDGTLDKIFSVTELNIILGDDDELELDGNGGSPPGGKGVVVCPNCNKEFKP